MKQILTFWVVALLVSSCVSVKPGEPQRLSETKKPNRLISKLQLCSVIRQEGLQPQCLEQKGDPNSSKKALVIGNGKYDFSSLPNPTNDARDMTNALISMGFNVTRAQNLDKQTMDKVISDFGKRLSDKEVALFYFSGHGAQANGENFLIPTNNDSIRVEEDLKQQAVSAKTTLAMMENTNPEGMNILILDACRDNPYRDGEKSLSKGLARVKNAPKGSFIAHAADEGQKALEGDGNGLYTTHLLKVLKNAKHKRIEDVFMEIRNSVVDKSGGKQEPWYQASLRMPFCFEECQ
jgi:uncharacterized caspase-like protein